METLKKINIIVCLTVLITVNVVAQNSPANKAFTASYAAEYKLNYPDAISALTSVYDDKSYEINLRLGWLYYCSKNYSSAVTYYTKASDLKPYAIEARLGLVKPLSAMESWDKVMKQYEEILKIDPQNSTTNYYTGMIYYNRKAYETASKYFEKVVNLYPFDYNSTLMLGWCYLNLNKMNDAKIMFNKTLLIQPSDSSALDGLARIK